MVSPSSSQQLKKQESRITFVCVHVTVGICMYIYLLFVLQWQDEEPEKEPVYKRGFSSGLALLFASIHLPDQSWCFVSTVRVV